MRDKNYFAIMKKSPLFRNLSHRELEDIYPDIVPTRKSYQGEEIIYNEGDEIRRVAIIQSGIVRSEKIYEEGEIHLIAVHDTGETICIEEASSFTRISPVAYVANDPVTLIHFDMDRLMQCKYRTKIMQNVIYALADDSIRRLYKIEMLSVRGLRNRIMAYLLRMEKKTGSQTFGINMDRERFAQYLCVNRSALSNELSQMKKDGLIQYRKGTFTILRKQK